MLTQRQIVIAEEQGVRPPKISIEFPPGFLEEFKHDFSRHH